jgi:SNF2 family DNA or RNA helicase
VYLETIIQCKNPLFYSILRDHIPTQEALERLQANDVNGAIDILQCKSGTQENIIDVITKHYQVKAHTETLNIQRFTELQGISDIERTERISACQLKYDDIMRRIDSIIERVTDLNGVMCPICLDDISVPRAITGCCQNSFCFPCILQAVTANNEKRCPLCKEPDCNKKINVIANRDVVDNQVESTSIPPEDDMKSKLKTLLNIIQNLQSTQRVLVFAKFGSIFNEMLFAIRNAGIRCSVLKGSVESQRKLISLYEEGVVPVILLNTEHSGAGLNLPMTTDVIVYHKLDTLTQKQVIGRAQRPGRTTQLMVTHLKYEDE